MIADALSVPWTDWLTPMLNKVTVRGVAATSAKKAATSASLRSHAAAVSASPSPSSEAQKSPGTSIRSSTSLGWTAPVRTKSARTPLNSAMSLPGRSGRNRSAPSAVSVRRGSITTSFVPRATRAASIRCQITGWHQAAFDPTSTMRSASSRSS